MRWIPHLGLLDLEGPTLDVCGTGGDQLDLFNVSTTAMFVAAAAGAVVVKHGNRGITSKSGGADVLEALGIRIDLGPDDFRNCIEQAGVGFMFAPMYHPAFKAVAGVRKNLAARGVRTIFNLIGPLLNPARPQCQLVGVFTRELCPAFAEILQRLGRDSAWVVHGTTGDGRSVDEVSLMGSTRICKSGLYQDIEDEEVRPRDFGLKHAEVDDLRGGDAKTNAAILEAILSGKRNRPETRHGPDERRCRAGLRRSGRQHGRRHRGRARDDRFRCRQRETATAAQGGWKRLISGPRQIQLGELRIDDALALLDLLETFFSRGGGELFERVDVIQIDFLDLADRGVDVARDGDVDEEQRPEFPRAADLLDLVAADDGMRRAGGGDDDVHAFEHALPVVETHGAAAHFRGEFRGAVV